MAAYAKAFPGWKLVKIDAKIVIPDEGAVHCITMQIPAGKRAKMEAAPKDLCGAKKLACAVASCGAITDDGCCDGNTLKYCQDGKLSAKDCAGNPSCGWNAAKAWYACGTSGGADPSGKVKKACPAAMTPDAGAPDLPPPSPDLAAPDLAPPDATLDAAAPDGSDPDGGCAVGAGEGGSPFLALSYILLIFLFRRARIV